MQGSYFALEIGAEGKDVLEYKNKDRTQFLKESERMINDFIKYSISCTYSGDPAVKNTTIRIFTF